MKTKYDHLREKLSDDQIELPVFETSNTARVSVEIQPKTAVSDNLSAKLKVLFLSDSQGRHCGQIL